MCNISSAGLKSVWLEIPTSLCACMWKWSDPIMTFDPHRAVTGIIVSMLLKIQKEKKNFPLLSVQAGFWSCTFLSCAVEGMLPHQGDTRGMRPYMDAVQSKNEYKPFLLNEISLQMCRPGSESPNWCIHTKHFYSDQPFILIICVQGNKANVFIRENDAYCSRTVCGPILHTSPRHGFRSPWCNRSTGGFIRDSGLLM